MTLTDFLAVNIAIFLFKSMMAMVGKAVLDESQLSSLAMNLGAIFMVVFSAYFNISATVSAFHQGNAAIVMLGSIILAVSFVPFLLRLIFLPVLIERY